jgi:hypothetical protein
MPYGQNAFERADGYREGERIVSNFTKRQGTVARWPEDKAPLVGAIWVKWDDGLESHAWRHQVHRSVEGGRQ